MPIEFRGLDQAHYSGGALTGAQKIRQRARCCGRVLPAGSGFRCGLLSMGAQLAIIDVADQGGPTSKAVVDRFPACRRAIRDLLPRWRVSHCRKGFGHRLSWIVAAAVVGVRPSASSFCSARFAFDLIKRAASTASTVLLGRSRCDDWRRGHEVSGGREPCNRSRSHRRSNSAL